MINDYSCLDPDIINYVESVITGREVAGQAIVLACKRFKDWFGKYYFDNNKVNRVIDFISHLKHFEDEFAGKPFILLPWLKWIVANIFGWYLLDDHSKRVIRNAFLLISRKSGKTSLSAAILLATLVVDLVPGSEIYLLANSKEQARIGFKFVKGFAESLDPKHKHFGIYRDYIYYHKTKSVLKVLSSDTMSQDGYGASVALIDEYAAAKDNGGYNIMKSSMGARKNPLIITISSANYLLDTYPCYEAWKVGIDILNNIKHDDHWFYGIWLLDDNDDWRDSKVWKKAAPNLGITVYNDYMEERITEATNDTAKEADVKTKNLNMWVQSLQGWLPHDLISSYMTHLDLTQLTDYDLGYMGVDLSAVSDLTAVSIMFPPCDQRTYYPDKFLFKTMLYIPLIALKESPNKSKYDIFIRNNYAKVTSGKAVDYDTILNDMLEVNDKHCIQRISYDAWNSQILNKKAEQEGLPMLAYSQAVGNFSIPTKAFEVLLRNGLILIDYNPAIIWCFNNVELKIDIHNNVKPMKAANDKNKKIDGVISMLECLGGYLLENDYYYGG